MFSKVSLTFKVLFLSLFLFSFYSEKAEAQSVVYLIGKKFANAESEVTVNGKDKFEFRGPVDKVKVTPPTSMTDTLVLTTYKSCIKKCTFNEPGKVLLNWKYNYTNPVNKNVQHYESEIQLNLTEGSVHYVELKIKITNDIEMVELNEKKGAKLVAKGKHVTLPEYVK